MGWLRARIGRYHLDGLVGIIWMEGWKATDRHLVMWQNILTSPLAYTLPSLPPFLGLLYCNISKLFARGRGTDSIYSLPSAKSADSVFTFTYYHYRAGWGLLSGIPVFNAAT
ncbi:MAG: hypothetical protein ACR5K7_05320 [Symbiopectobacterium sp.]